MFNNRIFDPDHLGSEEEGKSLPYDGWAVLANIRAENQIQLVEKVRHTFSGDGYEFSVKNGEYFIESDSCSATIRVIPQITKYTDTYSTRTETYNLIFQSIFFGGKWYDENKHQELCRNILSKIKKKRGFLVRDGKRFPIPRMKRITRQNRH